MEGPTTIVITKKVCEGCKYYKVERNLGMSHPTRYSCTHPEIREGTGVECRLIATIAISTPPETPKWCPFLTTKTNSNE
jgi:hypothetical protein